MNSKELKIIAEIDGVCGCKVAEFVPKRMETGAGAKPNCGACNKPHRTDFDFDDGAMMLLLNRYVEDSGFDSDDASERGYTHNYDGLKHHIEIVHSTHVFDDSIGQGSFFEGKGSNEDFIAAAKDALLQIVEKA